MFIAHMENVQEIILKILIYKIKTYQKNNSKTELIYFRVIQIFNVLYKY